mgnify:CR=1 FL=1
MKRTLLILSINLISILAFSQCQESQLFPFKHLASKFEVTKQLLLNDNFYNRKETFNYVDDDNVNQSGMLVYAKSYPCLDGNEIRLYFKFENDKLYQVTLVSIYGEDDFKKCMNKFNQLLEYFATKYKVYNTLTNYQGGEKECGETTNYVKKMNSNNSGMDDFISVGYNINYKVDYNWGGNKALITDNIESFEVEIMHINATGTLKSMFK